MKNVSFQPGGCATLIGSQPLEDHLEGTRMVLTYTPDVPTWVQLPFYKNEGMVPQFASGMPGLVREQGREYVDHTAEDFDEQLVDFFEAYLAVGENDSDWDGSRFTMTPEQARGFFVLLEQLAEAEHKPRAVKGQVTGPITFLTSLKDGRGRPVFYHDALRDAGTKLLALKAGWQARQLGRFGVPVIVFIDEPALAGYGSSEFISISKEDISVCLEEVIAAIHAQGALAGVHVCANTDWSLLLSSSLDIINFDAFGYFDKFILYGESIKTYLSSGRLLAWGMVPTLDPDQIEAATEESLFQKWREQSEAVQRLGVDAQALRRQSLITPSCGTGPLTPPQSLKVLELTRALSHRVQNM